MKARHALLVALLVFGCGLLWPMIDHLLHWPPHMSYVESAAVAIGFILLVVAASRIAAERTAVHHKHTRLNQDHFLPIIRRRKKHEPKRSASLPIRFGSRFLGSDWFTNLETGRPGRIRKILKKIGPTVVSSPFRRTVQAAFFIAYLWLFFYVCWPYSARPVAPGDQSSGWRLISFDQVTTSFRLEREQTSLDSADTWMPVSDSAVYLTQPASAGGSAQPSIRLRVKQSEMVTLELSPDDGLSDRQLDMLMLSDSDWVVHATAPDAWPTHYADDLQRKEVVPSEFYLAIDPLVSLSTAIAGRYWVWSLACAAVILVVSIVVPRGFCGYICPLGTVIDLFDWSIGRHVKRFRLTHGKGTDQAASPSRWWMNIRYYLLLATLVSSVFGLLISGFFSAIPVVTRGLLFLGEPIQSGFLRGWHLVAPLHWGHIFSICLFIAVLALGFLSPRFWCKYACPTGAIFSLGNLFRTMERKVESTCVGCDKCVQICPFDAIEPDFTTKTLNCTLCQTCAGVCPTQAIKFVDRWAHEPNDKPREPLASATDEKRRRFLGWSIGTAAGVGVGATVAVADQVFGGGDSAKSTPPVRPPGSVPEELFVDLCIRCGQCYKACPNGVLQPMGFEQGLTGLWTPRVDADWAGCESSCNACGQVCPTGAIRAIPMSEKRVAKIGLAIVQEKTCLPWADTGDCQLCVDECHAAGYHAIEFTYVHTQVDDNGLPLEDSGRLAPVVLADKCVGCGLCQTRCYGINVAEEKLLKESAIIIEAGEGREDRLTEGSYRQLREAERRQRQGNDRDEPEGTGYFVPETPGVAPPDSGIPFDPDSGAENLDNPFGIGPPPEDNDPFGTSPF